MQEIKNTFINEFIKENIYFLVDVSKMLFQFPGILRKLEIKKLEINEFDLIYLLIFPTIIIEEKGFYAYYELKQSPEVHQKSSNRKIKSNKIKPLIIYRATSLLVKFLDFFTLIKVNLFKS